MCYPQQLGRPWKVFGNLPRNLLEPHQPSALEPSGPHQLSAPEPSGTLSAICTGALPNPPGPRQLSARDLSGTSSAICTGTRRNLIRYLPRNHNLISHLNWNPPEPHQHLHRDPRGPSGTSSAIAPELFWAKDPLASFAVGEKQIDMFITTPWKEVQPVKPWFSMEKTAPTRSINLVERPAEPTWNQKWINRQATSGGLQPTLFWGTI